MYRQICGEICVCIYMWLLVVCFFFFKQKTAYDMRISDWSSDVCSSDLRAPALLVQTLDFVPTETHRTGGDRLQSDQGACQRRLARPRLADHRSEEHTSELQSLMRISYAVFCLKKKKTSHKTTKSHQYLQRP